MLTLFTFTFAKRRIHWFFTLYFGSLSSFSSPNRRFPRSMRSQGERRGCGSHVSVSTTEMLSTHDVTRAYISSSYVRKESPILSLSWWGWGSCYESVVLGAPYKAYARGNHSRSRTARSALNLVQHYIVTSHAAGLNIA